MTLEESLRIFNLNSESGEEERFKAYAEVKKQLEEKQAKAPTKGLQEKYELALSRLDEAIERIELNLEVTAKPLFESRGESSTANRSEKKSRLILKNRNMVVASAVVALAISAVGVGLWQWNLSERAKEQARIEAEAALKAEAEHEAEIKRLKKEQEENALKMELKLKRSLLQPVITILDQKLQKANTKLADLEATQRISTEYGNQKEEKELSSFRKTAYENYVEKLVGYVETLPVSIGMDRSKELEEKGNYSEAILAISNVEADRDQISNYIAKLEKTHYHEAVAEFTARKAFAKALEASKQNAIRENHSEAISLIKPYENNKYVEIEAGKALQNLYLAKRDHVFAEASEATKLGEHDAAREMVYALDEDTRKLELTSDQEALILKLNAEYAYKQALATAKLVSESGDYQQAKSILNYLLEDPHVGQRAKEEWDRLDTLANRHFEYENNATDEWNLVPESPTEGTKPKIEDTPPKVISQVEPSYPVSLKHRNVEGFVDLEWTVTPEGDVTKIEAVKSSHREFEEPAIAALRKWKFEPRRKDGELVSAKIRQRMLFAP